MSTQFELLKSEAPRIQAITQKPDETGFFIQEVLRFYSISETLYQSRFKLDKTASNDERYLTHVLLRSLLENYFILIYIFDDSSKTSTRYDELKNSFQNEYRKLVNDLNSPSWQSFMQAHQSKLEPANPTWAQPRGLPDINSMLMALQNNYGDRLNYLYPFYRITSFDTHGRSLGTIFESVFGKTCNFPVLDVKKAFELMANQYLVILNDLRGAGRI